MTHKALGRGLSALFSETQTSTKIDAPIASPLDATAVRELPVDAIVPNRHQPRTEFNEEALNDLALSIKSHGLAQPLVVTEKIDGGYELVVGERRLRASKIAGLETVPCIIRKMSNRERFELALIENIQRQDLNALEEAVALDGLMREFNLTQEQIAEGLGKSRSAVANMLRYLRLHEDVQAAIRSNEISEGHAKILAGLPDHSDQLRFLEKIKTEQMSVRQLEVLISGVKTKKKSKSDKVTEQIPEAKKYEEEFQRILARRVEIQTDGKKGWIRFAFYTPWDLELLCKKLGLLDAISGEPNE